MGLARGQSYASPYPPAIVAPEEAEVGAQKEGATFRINADGVQELA
jgi:hypothetical protein